MPSIILFIAYVLKSCCRCNVCMQNDGCNKMTCSSCHKYFCWLCCMFKMQSIYYHFYKINCRFHFIIPFYLICSIVNKASIIHYINARMMEINSEITSYLFSQCVLSRAMTILAPRVSYLPYLGRR